MAGDTRTVLPHALPASRPVSLAERPRNWCRFRGKRPASLLADFGVQAKVGCERRIAHAAMVPEDLWPEVKARVTVCYHVSQM